MIVNWQKHFHPLNLLSSLASGNGIVTVVASIPFYFSQFIEHNMMRFARGRIQKWQKIAANFPFFAFKLEQQFLLSFYFVFGWPSPAMASDWSRHNGNNILLDAKRKQLEKEKLMTNRPNEMWHIRTRTRTHTLTNNNSKTTNWCHWVATKRQRSFTQSHSLARSVNIRFVYPRLLLFENYSNDFNTLDIFDR